MKKNFLSLGLIAAAAFTLTNCTQELANPVEPSLDGVPFEIVVSPAETKTTNDGMSTVWAENDAINLFHAEAGETTYVSDGKFILTSENTFKGTLQGELTDSFSYDWYAIYPYSSYINTPASTSGGYSYIGSRSDRSQKQTGNNSMAHIAGSDYPLVGVRKDFEYFAGESVQIQMSHASSLLEVVVTNNTEEDLLVENISFTAPENIVGTFYVNFAGESLTFTDAQYVSKTANLEVENSAALAKGESAKFYLAVKPFKAAAGQKLTLSVNGFSKEVTVPSDMTFAAGKIKTLKFNYNKQTVAGEYTIDWDSVNDWVENATKYISGYYTIKTVKNAGSIEPTVNSSANDCRVYAKGSVTISHSASVNIKKIVFNISSKGKEQLADFTVSTGNVTVDATAYKVIWEGNAPSVTFTVGDKATNGTESDKSGQLCFDSIDVIAEPTDAPYVTVLKGIEVKGMKTEYNIGETFSFDGTVTAHYFNQESKVVTPTKVTEPSMSNEGNITITVEYTEGGVTAIASYNILVEDPNSVVGEVKTQTITFSSLGYANQTTVTEVKSGDVTITFNKGTNSNPPKYYTNGSAVRAYGGNYFTIAAGTNVTKVEFTFGSSDGSNTISADMGNYANGTWTGKSPSVKFTIGGTSGNRRLSKIVVTYEK